MKLGTILIWVELVALTVAPGWVQGATATSIPIELKDGYLVIAKGSIGGLHDLAFLLDTGTSRTMVDARIAKLLHLEGPGHTLTVFDREVKAQLVVLPDLQLGAVRAQSSSAIVKDLSGIRQNLGIQVDAVLGMDILRLETFSIDYNSKRIWFGDSEPTASSVPVEEGQPYLIVKARIDDFPVTLMIDTGCDDVALFANRLPNGFKKNYFKESRALTFAENSPPTQIGFGNLAVATFPAHKVSVKIISTGSNDMGYDGVVGVRALRASRIRFDFEQRTVSWR